jgi:biofilm PGA synthesis lipoprotein PgaB
VYCYHDVEDQPSRDVADTITVRRLVEHFEWLKAEGYTVISVDDVLAARAGLRPLPPKAIMLTFDDGYVSFATRVLPLLEAYRYPAVFAFVTSWLEVPPGGQVPYGSTPVPREKFVSLEQLRRIAASPWVEVASHSHELHRGLLANREGNELPAAIAREYDRATDSIESAEAYARRLHDDLARSAAVLEAMTGKRPRTLCWPYGRFNQIGIDAAHDVGYSVIFDLNPGLADTDNIDSIPRFYPSRDPEASVMERMIRPEIQPSLHRSARVDPATIATAPTNAERDAGLGALIDSTRALGLTALQMEAFSDRDGDGRPDTAFFPGSKFASPIDYLNRLAWQVRTRGGVNVVVRLPLATTDETDWNALGQAVPFDGMMFTDFVCGRDDPGRLHAALKVLRHYQPSLRLHLRVPPTPAEAGDWATLKPTFVWPERAAGPKELADWLHTPAARGRVALFLTAAEVVNSADWLARGLAHFALDGPPPPKASVTPALQQGLSARSDPFAQP